LHPATDTPTASSIAGIFIRTSRLSGMAVRQKAETMPATTEVVVPTPPPTPPPTEAPTTMAPPATVPAGDVVPGFDLPLDRVFG
jgi:hypothetical protein